MLSELVLERKYLDKLVMFQQDVFGSGIILVHLLAMFLSLSTFCFIFCFLPFCHCWKKKKEKKQKKPTKKLLVGTREAAGGTWLFLSLSCFGSVFCFATSFALSLVEGSGRAFSSYRWVSHLRVPQSASVTVKAGCEELQKDFVTVSDLPIK